MDNGNETLNAFLINEFTLPENFDAELSGSSNSCSAK